MGLAHLDTQGLAHIDRCPPFIPLLLTNLIVQDVQLAAENFALVLHLGCALIGRLQTQR